MVKPPAPKRDKLIALTETDAADIQRLYGPGLPVIVAPRRWEGMPYLLLEAVARHRRVIASDCPGNRDVLKGYGNATLFPVEDSLALSRLMEEIYSAQ